MISQIIGILKNSRVNLTNEKQTQLDISDAFTQKGISFEREVRLSAGDIVDFMVGDIAIEVKLTGSRKKDIFKQIGRYALHDRVKSIVLASNVTMGLPKEINKKSIYYVSLGAAWL